MKVYIVTQSDWDDTDIISAHASREAADRRLEELRTGKPESVGLESWGPWGRPHYDIVECEVENIDDRPPNPTVVDYRTSIDALREAKRRGMF